MMTAELDLKEFDIISNNLPQPLILCHEVAPFSESDFIKLAEDQVLLGLHEPADGWEGDAGLMMNAP